MSKIVEIDNFVGFHYLPRPCTEDPSLQVYIDRYEKQYLASLLGADYLEFYESLDTNNPPIDPDILAWYDPFVATNSCGCNACSFLSMGVKDMLTGFVYYHFAHDNQAQMSLTGLVYNANENSTMLTSEQTEAYILERYNESVRTYNAILRKRKGGCCVKRDKCRMEFQSTVI